ncbi:hypothetical protein ACPESU_38075 [Nocardia iowensis]
MPARQVGRQWALARRSEPRLCPRELLRDAELGGQPSAQAYTRVGWSGY